MADHATDEHLLEQAANGNTAAFQILYERYRDPIFRFAYRLLGSAEAAEDVAHDCFLGLIKDPGRFDSSKASLRTYLYAAARNQAAKRYQSFGRETAIEELADEPRSADLKGPMALVLNDELAGEVERAIAGLPPLQREALVLFEYEDLSLAEIAAIVGADSGTVKSRLFRAREKLRANLDRYFRIGNETVTVKRA
ncbi:MAG: polymerase sigma-70 factor, subfamily [Blastocatellia bacterium]|nr:polymerase sigma-70 factor, subfamily [Blastocatellia bacterium]